MTLTQREDQFLEQIKTFETDLQIVAEFYNYWSEPNKKGKMRFELEKTWDTKRRLKTWITNQTKWNGKGTNKNNGKPGTSTARVEALRNW